MAHSQQANWSPYIEIQNLKERLDASQKKVDRYAHLIANLSDELDNLRNNICHVCRNRLVPGNISAPEAVAVPSNTLPSASTLLSHHPSNLPAMPSPILSRDISSSSLSPAAATSEPTTNTPVGLSPAISRDSNDRAPISSERESESLSLKWSVVYNPDVKQALDIHVAHVFTYENPVSYAKISPDGQRLAIGLKDDGRTYIIDAKTKSNICVFVDLYIKDPLTIWSLQFSPDGQLVATAASDDRIRIWDIAQRRMRAMFKGHTSMINSIAFSPNGRFLASASDDRSVCIWNIRDGSPRKLPDDSTNLFLPVTFSPDGRYIAAGTYHSSLRIWDARTHKLVTKLHGHSYFPWCLEFTPDGKGLILEGTNHALEYLDVSPLGIHRVQRQEQVSIPEQNFRQIWCFSGHTAVIRSVGFLPGSNRWVLTCADDKSALLWDTETGVWQLMLEGHTGAVYAADFSPTTEGFLLTAGSDRHATLWKYEVL